MLVVASFIMISPDRIHERSPRGRTSALVKQPLMAELTLSCEEHGQTESVGSGDYFVVVH